MTVVAKGTRWGRWRRQIRALRDELRGAARPIATAWEVVPITVLGAVLAGLGLHGLRGYGPDHADHLVYALGAVALGVVGVSVVVVCAAALTLWLLLRGSASGVPETLMVGVENATDFRCPSLRWWPLVQVELEWITPDAVEVRVEHDGAALVERVTPRERGRYEALVRRVRVRDVFGFASLGFPMRWTQPLTLVPAVGRADTEVAVRRATSEGFSHPSGKPIGELVEMRRYVHGDPMRHVIWKTFARDRTLMVREAERAIAPRPAMVAFFVAGAHDEPSASTARLFLDNALFGADFAFAAEGAPRPTSRVPEALDQIIASRAHRHTQADGLGMLFRSVDRARLDNLVIFAPASDGPWVDKVLTATRHLPMPPMLILTVDGALDHTRRGRLQRLLWEHEDTTHPTLRALPSLHARLQRAHLDLRVIHRPTGRRLEAARIDALGVL